MVRFMEHKIRTQYAIEKSQKACNAHALSKLFLWGCWGLLLHSHLLSLRDDRLVRFAPSPVFLSLRSSLSRKLERANAIRSKLVEPQ
jgi:hypothetical protein